MRLQGYACEHPTIAGRPCAICATHGAKTMENYERDELTKLRMLVKAAQLNNTVSGGGRITMTISGTNPSMSITMEAYVLEKFIKEEVR
jgi:hypothetical protein